MVILANLKSLIIIELGKIIVNLTNRSTNCGMISPRFDTQFKDLEREKKKTNLLASQSGFIVPTTSVSIMNNEDQNENIGGKTLGPFI